ncbi:MAG: hypothetical protein ACE37B_24125 [Ilumatobacter sp.]
MNHRPGLDSLHRHHPNTSTLAAHTLAIRTSLAAHTADTCTYAT